MSRARNTQSEGSDEDYEASEGSDFPESRPTRKRTWQAGFQDEPLQRQHYAPTNPKAASAQGGIFKTAAIEVLNQEKRLMATGELTRVALERKLLVCQGKTPDATMASALYTDVRKKGGSSPFIKPKQGLFGLRTWLKEPWLQEWLAKEGIHTSDFVPGSSAASSGRNTSGSAGSGVRKVQKKVARGRGGAAAGGGNAKSRAAQRGSYSAAYSDEEEEEEDGGYGGAGSDGDGSDGDDDRVDGRPTGRYNGHAAAPVAAVRSQPAAAHAAGGTSGYGRPPLHPGMGGGHGRVVGSATAGSSGQRLGAHGSSYGALQQYQQQQQQQQQQHEQQQQHHEQQHHSLLDRAMQNQAAVSGYHAAYSQAMEAAQAASASIYAAAQQQQQQRVLQLQALQQRGGMGALLPGHMGPAAAGGLKGNFGAPAHGYGPSAAGAKGTGVIGALGGMGAFRAPGAGPGSAYQGNLQLGGLGPLYNGLPPGQTLQGVALAALAAAAQRREAAAAAASAQNGGQLPAGLPVGAGMGGFGALGGIAPLEGVGPFAGVQNGNGALRGNQGLYQL